MSDWYYVPGMEYPFWNVSIENDCAMNVEADTDMGNLTVDEFTSFFPAPARSPKNRSIRVGEDATDPGGHFRHCRRR